MPNPPTKPFERKWTPEQRAAIARAILDRRPKMSARKAAEAGARGELSDGNGGRVPAFGRGRPGGGYDPMPTNTAQDIARRERHARAYAERGRLARSSTADEACRIVMHDAWGAIDEERQRLRKANALGIRARTQAWRELVAAANDLRKLEKELDPDPPSKRRTTTKPDTNNSGADGLAKAAKKRARTEQRSAPTTQGPSSAAHNSHASGTAQDAKDSVTQAVTQEPSNPLLSALQSG